MKFTSWHFVLILAAVVLFLTGRNSPYATRRKTTPPKWHFSSSPHGGATSATIKSLDQAKKSILAQACSFISVPIASALLSARRMGVDVHAVRETGLIRRVVVLVDRIDRLIRRHQHTP